MDRTLCCRGEKKYKTSVKTLTVSADTLHPGVAPSPSSPGLHEPGPSCPTAAPVPGPCGTAQGHGDWGGIFRRSLLPAAEDTVAVDPQGWARNTCAAGAGTRMPRMDRRQGERGEGERAQQGWHHLQKGWEVMQRAPCPADTAMVSALPHCSCSVSILFFFITFSTLYFTDFVVFVVQCGFHTHVWAHANTRTTCVTSVWIIHEKHSGDLRHHLPITRTVKPANDCGKEGISSVGTPEFPHPQWLSPRQAGFPNACWLKEPLVQTEAALSPCAKCVSEARGRAGLCEWQPVLEALSTSAGLMSPPPTAAPRGPRPSRPERLRAAKGWRWLPGARGRAVYKCFSSPVSIVCRSLAANLGGSRWTWATPSSSLC